MIDTLSRSELHERLLAGEVVTINPQANHTKDNSLVIPPGIFASPIGVGNSDHRVIHQRVVLNGVSRDIELIHQLRAGDCGLACFLNTHSFTDAMRFNTDGRLPMTITAARQLAINLRREEGEDYREIVHPDSPIYYKDAVRLFGRIYFGRPKQEDIVTIEGRGKSTLDLQRSAMGIIDKLDEYRSGLCVTGLRYHCRSLLRLPTEYALIDPMNSQGVQFMHPKEVLFFLVDHMRGAEADKNFFFFVRG